MKFQSSLVVLVAGLLSACVMSSLGAMPGGVSDNEKPPTDDVSKMVNGVGPQIKSQTMALMASSDGGNSTSTSQQQFSDSPIQVLGYKTQIVAGTNYFVKYQINGTVFQAKIYKDLSGNATVSKVIGPMQASDPINYF